MRVAILGSALFGFREPFAGGMEAHTWDLTTGLRALGHDVVVYAGPGSDRRAGAVSMWDGRLRLSETARRDVSMTGEQQLAEHMAYQRTVVRLLRADDVDVVHLNCVHPLPVAMAGALPMPVTATLHSPPTPWLELAYAEARADRCAPRAVAVSSSLATAWESAAGWRPGVVPNGVDLDRWRPGAGDGGYAVWTGRLVREKGAHVAMDAARRAGMRLLIAGPAHDDAYLAEEIVPRLGPDAVLVGHLGREALAALVGAASVAVVTPLWEEPFGLVVAEALACGTPVAGIARGALPDLVGPRVGALVDPEGDDVVGALADAMLVARSRDRRTVRRMAAARFDRSLMVRRYENLLTEAVAGRAVPGPRALHEGAA